MFQSAIRTGLTACLVAIGLTAVSGAVAGGDTAAPDNAKAYFINLKNGDTVTSPFAVQFGLSGMGVSPAGVQNIANSGHHHLIINKKIDAQMLGRPLPADKNHVHFGKGQTETQLKLPAGQHTLQLLLGDWKHTPHSKPVMSEAITITVK
jgi:hypothetical protein